MCQCYIQKNTLSPSDSSLSFIGDARNKSKKKLFLGKAVDLIVLDENPDEVDEKSINKIVVIITIFNGATE